MKRKFKSSILVLFTVCCLVVPLQAVQHSPPWADNYDFNYVEPIVEPNLVMDSRPSANNAAYYQDLMDYDGHANTDYSAAQAYSALPDDAIFSFHGHGDNYRLLFVNQTAKSWFYTSDYGNSVPGSYFLSDFNNGELNDILLILFVSCHSAKTNLTYGNWLTMSRSKGVDNAIGFTGDIANNKAKYWNNRFWEHCNQNYTISQAAYWAKVETALHTFPTWYYGGVDTYVIDGNGQTKLKPARYGS